MRRRFLAFLAVPPPLLARPALAERRDHERARAALEAGQVRPLSEILFGVERRFHGRVIEAELETDDGHWRYAIKILPPNGEVFTLVVDAVTGDVLHSGRRIPPT